MIFFDIETIRDPDLWDEVYLERYKEKMPFMPEFNKIFCIAYTDCLPLSDAYAPEVITLDGDEKAMIEKFFSLTEKAIIGFNIKGFDLPFIFKRALRHGIPIPERLKLYGKKPWEMENIIDLYDIAKYTNLYGGGSLDTLMRLFGLESPKGSLDGSLVQSYVDIGKGEEVKNYCASDVIACVSVYKRFQELNVM